MDAKDEIINATVIGSDGNGDNLQRLTTNRRRPTTDPPGLPMETPSPSELSGTTTSGEIYVMDAVPKVRPTHRCASPPTRRETQPNFSPDGSRVAFTSGRDGNHRDLHNERRRLRAEAAHQKRGRHEIPPGRRTARRSRSRPPGSGGDHEIYVMKARPEGRRTAPRTSPRTMCRPRS